ncbi:MAG: ATP-binding protein [Nitrospirae bacterium]|nr:ATP-binding protein [Nitrospirota bacterium]
MIKRTLSSKLISLSKKFPVVSITGPRQSGKTTLARMVFKGYNYVSLEDPDEKEFATNDPKGFLRRFTKGVILDEIQKTPQLLSYIQGIVDIDDSPGKFILTGSQQFHLMHKISQTLAGRSAIVHLLPFSLSELSRRKPLNPYTFDTLSKIKKQPQLSLEILLYRGLYPRIHDKKLDAHDWLSAYYRTYVERDVRDIINIGNLDAFQRFVRLCAGRTGQLLNLSSLSADCGISHTTARQWLSVLQAGFIVYLLPPHYANFSKRLIKSPKLYFLDSGLLCYLLRIREPADVLIHPLRGSIFESFVLSELYKTFSHLGQVPPLYYWRDRTGHEVDIVVDIGKRLIPVEIKSGETIAGTFFDGLRYYMSLKGNTAGTGVLVYGGEYSYKRNNFVVRTWFQCS